MTIIIPRQLCDRLNESPSLAASVHVAIRKFSPWIDSPMAFFPDFTDHSTQHLTRLLSLAEGLIPERSADRDAWSTLSPGDSACMILAALLHDAAMHLTEDSFLALLDNPHAIPPSSLYDRGSWASLWSAFTAEIHLWNDRTRQRICGVCHDTNSVFTELSKHPLDAHRWTSSHRLVIGEFVRRHHARLAHEFALTGVPGPHGPLLRIEWPEDFGDLADLVGMIARSHGMPIRHALRFFEQHDYTKYRREFQRIHAVFVMGLLRIADYLDLYAERAPTSLLLVKALKSRYSKGEWDAHGAIENIAMGTRDDPEALTIDARPRTVRDYLRLRSWLDSIQAELDQTWAVLGEVYGPARSLQSLGLSIRRIKSNLDDVPQFAARPDTTYIPVKAQFGVAGPDLLKHLIDPLYGARPEVGIRELMQNAIDAVLEGRAWQASNGTTSIRPSDLGSLPHEAEVLVSVCRRTDSIRPYCITVPADWQYWVEVADCGIGMTADTVINYFLRAGASFRDNSAWAQCFVSGTGQIAVLRSGRFGVGSLACFLLGPEICVTTRHVSCEPHAGLSFQAILADDLIELKPVVRPPGTTILVRINEDTYHRLKAGEEEWSWYCLSDVRVKRRVQPGRALLRQLHSLPNMDSRRKDGWRQCVIPPYERIDWTFQEAPALVCNGLVVGAAANAENEEEYPINLSWADSTADQGEDVRPIQFRVPAVSVFDRLGVLPLTMNRFGLVTRSLPFSEELLRDVIRHYCAFVLEFAPQDGHPTAAEQINEYQKTVGLQHFVAPWLRVKGGVVPVDGRVAAEANVRRLMVASTDRLLYGRVADVHAHMRTSLPLLEMRHHRADDVLRVCLGNGIPIASPFEVTGVQAIVHEELLTPGEVETQEHFDWIRRLKATATRPRQERQSPWRVIRSGRVPRSASDLRPYASGTYLNRSKAQDFIAEWYVADNRRTTGVFWSVWSKELRMPAVIPTNIEDRGRSCEYALEQLRPLLGTDYRKRVNALKNSASKAKVRR